MFFRRPELFPTLVFLSALAMFITLGSWQIERLHWKQAILQEAETATAKPPLMQIPTSYDGLTYRTVRLSGRFLYDHSFHLIGRQQGSVLGYYMVTPFVIEGDGRVLLVNRGFAPPGKEARPEGVVQVEGIIRPPREKRFFVPENRPDHNIWSYEDIDRMSESLPAPALPFVVEAVGPREADHFPIPGDGKVIFRNDHLGYAITWYALAAVSIIMFGAYYRRRD